MRQMCVPSLLPCLFLSLCCCCVSLIMPVWLEVIARLVLPCVFEAPPLFMSAPPWFAVFVSAFHSLCVFASFSAALISEWVPISLSGALGLSLWCVTVKGLCGCCMWSWGLLAWWVTAGMAGPPGWIWWWGLASGCWDLTRLPVLVILRDWWTCKSGNSWPSCCLVYIRLHVSEVFCWSLVLEQSHWCGHVC